MEKICEQAITAYLKTLKDTFEVVPTETGCVLVTPFLRSDNEYIELEIFPRSEGQMLITDNSDTVGYLFTHGLHVNRSNELKKQIKTIEKRFSIQIQNNEIYTIANSENLGDALNSIINAVQDVSYLIYKKLKRSPVSFFEEVEKYLIKNEVRYDPQFAVQGESYLHTFRFHLNDGKNVLLEPLTSTSPHSALDRAERLAFWWVDIASKEPKFRKVAILDDVGKREGIWSGKPMSVLEKYSDLVILWRQKEELLKHVRD